MRYDWQGHEHEVTGYSDSDWAGCRVTGKSTSGGAIMIGGHFIKGWARTPNHVTLSSAEAELVALVKCSTELMGIRSLLRDFGVDSEGVVYADSSAALAIAKRKGAGKMRHININCLWIQEKVDEKQLELRKVLGTKNPADMMTKHLARLPLDGCMSQLNQHRVDGRARAGLNIQGAQKQPDDNAKPAPAKATPCSVCRSKPGVTFSPPTVISVPSWKEETKRMNHNRPAVTHAPNSPRSRLITEATA